MKGSGGGGGISDSEKFELYQGLEKAEARVIALEKQVCICIVIYM